MTHLSYSNYPGGSKRSTGDNVGLEEQGWAEEKHGKDIQAEGTG